MGINNSRQMKELPASKMEMTRVLGIVSCDEESEFRPACAITRDPEALLKPRKKIGDDSFQLSLQYGFSPKFTSPQYEKFLQKKKDFLKERLPPRVFEMAVIYQDRRNSLRVPRKRLKVLFTIPVFVFWFLLLYINNNAPKSDMLTRQSQSYHPRNVQNALKSDIMITEKTPSKEFKGIRNLHNQRQIIIRKETSPKTKNNRLSIQRKRKVHLHNLLSNNKTKRILYENQQHYLCANWDLGALGNKLFIYASLYGIAQTTGMRLVVEENIVIRKFFKKLKAVSIPENNTMCKNAVWYTEKKPCSYDKTVYEFPKNKNIIHDSYLQSWYYFKNVYDDIREQFEFKDEIITQAQSKIQKALQLYGHDFKSVLVGIHIRMSDKLGKEAKGEGHLVATKEFYNRSMNYFRTKFKNPVFIIVMSWIRESDVKWVKRNLKGSDVVFLGSSSIEVDLCALSLCNHTIMTTGTFGWWGAWLCNGITVYCKNFAVKGSEVDGYYSADLKDYFPAGWIGM